MTAPVLVLLVSLSAPPVELPLADWVAELGNENRATQQAAYEALLKAGPKAKAAVPALVKALGAKNVQTAYVADILGAIGPDAKEAVPALLGHLPKEDSWGVETETIARAVAKIDGPKIEATRALLLTQSRCQPINLLGSQTLQEYPAQVIPHVLALCGDKDWQVRVKAVTVLGTLKQVLKPNTKTLFDRAGAAARDVAPALGQLLGDESADVRLAAAQAVTHVVPELADRALPVVIALAVESAEKKKDMPRAWEVFHPVPEQSAKVLIPLLDHPNTRARDWAIGLLVPLPIRSPIEDALKDGTTARIRQGAAMTLGGRCHSALDSAPALRGALKDREFIVRFAAAEALVWVGSSGSEWYTAAVPALVEGLGHEAEPVRIAAGHKLRMIGPAAQAAVPALQKLLGDDKSAVRIETALALVAIDVKEATGTVPALIEGLKASVHPAMEAAQALAELGPVAKDAVPELVKHFDAESPHVRLYSAEAAARIDPEQAPKAVEVLVGMLKDKKYKKSMVRSYSLGALQRIGAPAKSALPALKELLTDNGPFHADVALALIAIEPEGTNPAFQWAREALLSKNADEDTYDLIERLPQLGHKGKPLVPDLVALLKSESGDSRASAVALLAAIGREARAALPDLKKAAESDPQPKVRKLAAEAIKKIEAK
jgi:HEAT repeat protein